jgi:hypothetical protein
MRSYSTQHRFYAVIDLHARNLQRCVLAKLCGASARRFEEPTWGTHDFLRRKSRCLQSVRPGEGLSAFDPADLVGAVFGLQPRKEKRGADHMAKVNSFRE